MNDDEDLRERMERLERQVEYLYRHFGLNAVVVQTASVDPEVLRLKRSGNVIEAIKRYRLLTGLGLKEAKDYVDGL